MTHTITIEIPKTEVKQMQEFLDSKGDGTLNTIKTYTANFGDTGEGVIQVDIKVCDGEGDPFVDPVIFQDNCDAGCLDVTDTLVGKYVFASFLKDTYTVIVKEV